MIWYDKLRDMRHNRSAGAGLRRGALFTTLAFSAVLVPRLGAQDAVAKYEAQYENDGNPVHRARILAKLGPLAVTAAGKPLEAGQNDQALSSLRHFRDEVRDTTQALDASGVDAERHPGGFKELQIGLRQTIRRFDDLIFALPSDDRAPFEAVRSDLAATQNALINELFPPSEKRRKKEKE